MKVYLNGDLVERSQAKVSIDDRGFLFGDGVYEVTRIRGGRFFEGERHERRLARNLSELELTLPAGVTPQSLGQVALRLAAENGIGQGEALAYFQVTRGVAPRAHQFPVGVAATVFVSVGPFTPPDALRSKGVSCVSYPDIRWSRCDIKSVNLLPNVLAKQFAVSKGAYEAFFVRDGVFTEGASTNFFAVVDGEIRTYRNSQMILPGISRDVALDLASAEGIAVREEPLRVDELPRAAELFLTSTMNDVMPVVSLDGRTIGDGRPGPVTSRLARVFDAHLAAQCGPAVSAPAAAV